MGHTLITITVKTTTETEAEQKAWVTLETIRDFGIVVDSKEDLEREYPDTYRWKSLDPTNPDYKETARVESEHEQKFVRSSYPHAVDAGYVRDEE
jgi:hypothetical protein